MVNVLHTSDMESVHKLVTHSNPFLPLLPPGHEALPWGNPRSLPEPVYRIIMDYGRSRGAVAIHNTLKTGTRHSAVPTLHVHILKHMFRLCDKWRRLVSSVKMAYMYVVYTQFTATVDSGSVYTLHMRTQLFSANSGVCNGHSHVRVHSWSEV